MKLPSILILTRKKKAALLVLAAWLMFTTMIALSRVASAQSSVPLVLFFQYAISAFVMLPWVLKGRGANLPLSKVGVVVLRSVMGFLNYAFLFLAVQRIPLVNTVLLNNSAPLFVPLIILAWKKVKIKRRLMMGILVGFGGISLILKPTNELLSTGAIFGLCSAVCLSISMIAQRRLVKKEPIHLINFYYFAISTLICLPFIIDRWQVFSPQLLLLFGAIGLLFVCGSYLSAKASRLEKPTFLVAFNYSSIVYGALIQWLFWGNFPGWVSVTGITIVCLGGLITLGRDKKPKQTQLPLEKKTPEAIEDPSPLDPESNQ